MLKIVEIGDCPTFLLIFTLLGPAIVIPGSLAQIDLPPDLDILTVWYMPLNLRS
jgi:hypothetical protein